MFGVLILELLTGRRLVEYGEDSFVILSDHVRVLLEQGNVLKCIDPTMEEEYSEDEVLPFLKLVLVCTSQIPSNLPTMAKIVQILQAISSSVPHYHRMLDSFSKSSVLIWFSIMQYFLSFFLFFFTFLVEIAFFHNGMFYLFRYVIMNLLDDHWPLLSLIGFFLRIFRVFVS